MRLALVCLIGLLMISAPWTALAEDQSEVDMTVVAEGSAAVIGGDVGRAEDEAIADAKRNAVEQAIGVFVKSEALGKNYVAVEKTILTKSEGYIVSWEKVEGSRKTEKVDKDTLLSIKIKAKVGLIGLIDAMSDIEEVYNSMQRPRVMVLISENNLGQKSDDLPASAAAIMRTLQDRKFDVVDPDVVKRVIAKDAARAVIEGADAKAAALIAQDEGAEILVLGSAKSAQQVLPEDAGDAIKAASAILGARIVYADTGEVLYTAPQAKGRGVSTSDVTEAGLKALDDAGSKLISDDNQRFSSQVLARWAKEVQNGRAMRLIADNVAYADLTALKKVLREFRGFVEFVGQDKFQGKTATITVRTKLTPDQFRERLSEAKVGKKKVEIGMVSGAVTAITLK